MTFSRNFVAIYEIKPVLMLDKPIYVGFSILDLSKLFIYDFQCSYIKTKNSRSNKVLFTETESLAYEIKTDDVYEDFSWDKTLFDFGSYRRIRGFIILLFVK